MGPRPLALALASTGARRWPLFEAARLQRSASGRVTSAGATGRTGRQRCSPENRTVRYRLRRHARRAEALEAAYGDALWAHRLRPSGRHWAADPWSPDHILGRIGPPQMHSALPAKNEIGAREGGIRIPLILTTWLR